MSELPRDKFGAPIQTLYRGASQDLDLLDTSQRTGAGIAAASQHVRLCATVDCYYRFGDGTVTASRDGASSLLPAHAIEYRPVPPGAFIAAIKRDSATEDGILNIEETA